MIRVIILCLLMVSCAPKYEYDNADKILLTTAIVAQIADGVTTSKALERGGVEMNPFFGESPSDIQLAIAKSAVIGLIIYGGSKMKPPVRKFIFIFATLLGGGAAINNSGVNN